MSCAPAQKCGKSGPFSLQRNSSQTQEPHQIKKAMTWILCSHARPCDEDDQGCTPCHYLHCSGKALHSFEGMDNHILLFCARQRPLVFHTSLGVIIVAMSDKLKLQAFFSPLQARPISDCV